MKIVLRSFSLRFVMFWQKEISANATRKVLMKLNEGLLIFVVLICKPKILKKLGQKIQVSRQISSTETSNSGKETKITNLPQPVACNNSQIQL